MFNGHKASIAGNRGHDNIDAWQDRAGTYGHDRLKLNKREKLAVDLNKLLRMAAKEGDGGRCSAPDAQQHAADHRWLSQRLRGHGKLTTNYKECVWIARGRSHYGVLQICCPCHPSLWIPFSHAACRVPLSSDA